MTQTLHTQHDPSLVKLQLRDDVTHSLQVSNGDAFVMAYDSLHGTYFRLGTDEWQVAKLFDGERTLRQVVQTVQATTDGPKMSPEELLRFGRWLVQSKLANMNEGELNSQDKETNNARLFSVQAVGKLATWNPLFVKVELPNPQPFLQAIHPLLSWLFAPLSILLALTVYATGVFAIGSNWSRFSTSLTDIFAPGQWLQFLFIWLSLKLIHELGHAVCCQRMGGHVTRWGLMFILFSPIAWVDVTSAWGFRSKWKKIAVSAAGVYIELLIAAVAAIVWSKTTNPLIAALSRNVVVSASVTSILFNLNVLMRFDGYFILSDLLELQNLYATGQQYLQYAQRRYVLGFKATPLRLAGWKLHFVKFYGVAAMIWRLVFYAGIVIVAAKLFYGAGLILAVLSGLLWFGLPFAQLCTQAFRGSGGEQPRPLRFAMLATASLLLLAVVLQLPWPGNTRAFGYVEYSPLQILRADEGGFVRDVAVQARDHVKKGQLLATLENPQLHRQVADLDLQIEIQEIEKRIAYNEEDLGRYDAIGEKLRSLRSQRQQLAELAAALTVIAPIDGEVVTSELEALPGTYVAPGGEIVAVGAPGTKEIRISIPQQAAPAFRAASNLPVRVNIEGRRLSSNSAYFSHVTPSATRRVLHPALSATADGPLAVHETDGTTDDEIALVHPNFEGIVKLPSSLSAELRAGEICEVRLGRGHIRIYEKLWSLAQAFAAKKS